MSTSKYTKEYLEPIIKGCLSFRQVIQKLGLKPSGGNHSYIRNVVKKLSIDTSHFRGKGANYGSNHRGNKISSEQVLVLDRFEGRREQSKLLRRSLIDSGVQEKCSCGLGPEWNGKKLVLQIDHIDGNPLNNLKENLRFLCPNCHSQTETFGARNQ